MHVRLARESHGRPLPEQRHRFRPPNRAAREPSTESGRRMLARQTEKFNMRAGAHRKAHSDKVLRLARFAEVLPKDGRMRGCAGKLNHLPRSTLRATSGPPASSGHLVTPGEFSCVSAALCVVLSRHMALAPRSRSAGSRRAVIYFTGRRCTRRVDDHAVVYSLRNPLNRTRCCSSSLKRRMHMSCVT